MKDTGTLEILHFCVVAIVYEVKDTTVKKSFTAKKVVKTDWLSISSSLFYSKQKTDGLGYSVLIVGTYSEHVSWP